MKMLTAREQAGGPVDVDCRFLSGLKVDTFLFIRNVSGEFIFILKIFTLQIVDKSTSYTFKIVN